MINNRFKNWNNFLLGYVGIKPFMTYHKNTKCKVVGCNNLAKTKNMCRKHYSQAKTYGEIRDYENIEKNKVILNESYAKIEVYSIDGSIKEYVLVDKEALDKIDKNTIYTARKYAVIILENEKKRLTEFLYGELEDNNVYSYKNKNRLDCRKENIISISHTEQVRASKIQERNTTGVKGIYKKKSGKYEVSIAGKYLGSFDNFIEAKEIRLLAEEKLWGKIYHQD